MEGGRQIDGDDRVPFFDREILDRRDELDAGIVDENVERTELALRIGDHRGDLGRLRHIGAVVERFDPEIFFDIGPLGLDRRRIAHAVNDDIDAFLGERAGDGEADAAG